MKRLLLIMMVFGFAGQSWGQNKASITRQQLFRTNNNTDLEPTLFWAQYDATRRGSFIYVDAQKRVRMLSENPPDAAIQSITEITAKVKGLKGDIGEAEAAFKTQKSIADMAKRTAAVNMLRDALYRLNELYYATADEKKDIIKQLSNFDKKTINIQTNEEQATTVDINKMNVFQPTLASHDIKSMFEKVITTTKDIAVEEAKVDLESEKTKQEEAKKEIEKQKSVQVQLKLIQEVLEKTDKKLNEEESKKLIEQILKTK